MFHIKRIGKLGFLNLDLSFTRRIGQVSLLMSATHRTLPRNHIATGYGVGLQMLSGWTHNYEVNCLLNE